MVGLLLCVVALIVIVVLKQYWTFVIRLIAYLSLVCTFEAVVTIMQVIPVHHNGNTAKVKEGLSAWLVCCCWVSSTGDSYAV